MLVTHQLHFALECDQILVMQKGVLVEEGEADQLYFNPQQPYTQQLIAALPKGINDFNQAEFINNILYLIFPIATFQNFIL